jgi:hypothetical protein
LGEGRGANRREGACHGLARRRGRTCKRERLRAPQCPSGSSLDIRSCGWTEGGEYGKEIYGGENGLYNVRDQRQDIRNWPGLGDVLKRTVW